MSTSMVRAPTGIVTVCKDPPLVRRLAGDLELAITTARKSLVSVDPRGIDACANRQISDDLAVVGAHDDQLLRVTASNEKKLLRGVGANDQTIAFCGTEHKTYAKDQDKTGEECSYPQRDVRESYSTLGVKILEIRRIRLGIEELWELLCEYRRLISAKGVRLCRVNSTLLRLPPP